MRYLCAALVLAMTTVSAWASGPAGGTPLVDKFTKVISRIQPVAERECHRQTSGMSCAFRFILDKRRGVGANAHQTLDESGNPVIRVTKGLLEKLHSEDELAFVLAHEAGHHIGGHLARSRNTTGLKHISFASLGFDDEVAGSRAQRRAFELEADGLGALIARRAGYDPIEGAACLARMNKPTHGNGATHPPLADRMAMVRRMLGH